MKSSFSTFLVISIGFFCTLIGTAFPLWAQPIPGEAEGIPFLATFGKNAQKKWGDDDFSQVYFFVIPKDVNQQIFIKVFDPNVGGKHDEARGDYDSRTRFEVYGGRNTITPKAAKSPDPIPGYDSGVLMDSKTFNDSPTYDDKWYTFGPYNPKEGELAPEFGGYVFKIIAKGLTGDDGNLYRYFLSSSLQHNIPVEGSNGFTYECSFRMPNNASICHIYPYIDEKVVSIKQFNFDWDYDGKIRMVSVARRGDEAAMSGDGAWVSSQHVIHEKEKGGSIDIQIIKTNAKENNNVVFKVTNQYNEAMPFYSVPIGGIPRYVPNIKATPKN